MWRKILIIVVVLFLAVTVLSSLSRPHQKAGKTETSLPENLPKYVVWYADHETGDASQWEIGTPSKPFQDSGICLRPKNGVSDEVAHSGRYALKMSIQSWFLHSGCRTFRYPEVRSGEPYYYSAWIYFPEDYQVNGWSNIMQFKAKPFNQRGGGSLLFWSLRLLNHENGDMYFQLHWDQQNEWAGPTADGEPLIGKYYDQNIATVRPGQWVQVEMYLKQSSEFDGQIIVWQDGVEIYNVTNIRTKMPDGFNSWSVNSYGGGITPEPFTVYVDDAVVSTERVGPL
ncbi:heparin lyase I family protein [Candidatus Roizmanbacteria bacterium]|nr:heparin lyase I family protein [Candidatus Roizmanbacteria bacterium]